MKTVSISGKGGTGKSTLAALIIRWLKENITSSILAVDADANVTLNEMLGVELGETIGAIREELMSKVKDIPGGMTKAQFLEYKIHAALVENPHFDLIAMGRPEGPGCYCYANNLLREILMTLGENYTYMVIDNEAGMEHLSRRTTQQIDYLLVVSDPSPKGVKTAGRISRLLAELETRVEKKYIILNRVRDPLSPTLKEAINRVGIKLLGSVPEDEAILDADRSGRPLWNINLESPAFRAVDRMMKKLTLEKT